MDTQAAGRCQGQTLSPRAGDSCRDWRAPWGDCSICRMLRPEGEAVRQRTPSARCPAGDLLRLVPCLPTCPVSTCQAWLNSLPGSHRASTWHMLS